MIRFRTLRVLAVALVVATLAAPAAAFDHLDGPAVISDPATDITDLFAWMSPDATRVNLVLTVFPAATSLSKFSSVAAYVFHTSSRSDFVSPTTVPVDVICTFGAGAPTATSCWVGQDEYVTGDASATAGLTSGDGRVRVFAGPRDDPAFVNLAGYQHFLSTLVAGAGTFSFDAAGCPGLNAPTSAALISELNHDATGSGPPADFFAGQSVLAVVVSVDVALLTAGGPIVSVWGSTNQL